MEVIEIVLLILGILAVIASFLVPEKKEKRVYRGLSEEEIRDVVRDEYEQSRDRMDGLTDETINYTMEKAERQLERITNEKMMAMGEYSDTILNEIARNHQEVVFLSDMLNNNKNDLTVFLGQALQDAREATALATDAIENSRRASDDAIAAFAKSKEAMDNAIIAEDNMLNARRIIQGDVAEEPPIMIEPVVEMGEEIQEPSAKTKKTTRTRKKDAPQIFPEVTTNIDGIELVDPGVKSKAARTSKKAASNKMPSFNFDMGGVPTVNNNVNNNEMILKLHNQGKSNVAIARELGLGVGEVKLVIDLFK